MIKLLQLIMDLFTVQRMQLFWKKWSRINKPIQHIDNKNKELISLTNFGTEQTTFGVPSTRAMMNKIGLNQLGFKFTIRPNNIYRYTDREPDEYENLRRNNLPMISPREMINQTAEETLLNTETNKTGSRKSLDPKRNIALNIDHLRLDNILSKYPQFRNHRNI